MKKTLFVALLSVAALAACGKKKAAAPAGADACAAGAKTLAAVTFADVKKQHPKVDPAGEGALAGAVQASCVGDKWGEDVAKCYADAKSQADLQSCTKLLSKDQQQAFDKDLKSVSFDEPAPAGSGSAATPPAEGSGAAEGSAHAEGSAEGSAHAEGGAEGSAHAEGSAATP